MKPIAHALGDAARQLERDQRHRAARCRAADGRGAPHRPRQAAPLAARPGGARALLGDGRAAQEGEPVAYITGRRAFWNIELHVGPGVLIPRPDQRGADRLGDRAFRGHATGRSGSSISAPGPGTLLLAALDVWPEATGSASTFASGFVLCRRQRAPPRLREAGSSSSGDWAEGLIEKFDLILCNPPYIAEDAKLGPGVREYEPDEALVRRQAKASMPIARSRRSCRAARTAAASRRSRSAPIRRAVTGFSRATASMRGRARPCRTRSAIVLTWI